jgi:hypothetical protein
VHRSIDFWVLTALGVDRQDMRHLKWVSSEAASQLATAASVSGAMAGAVGLIVGVLSTRSVTDSAARFSDVGVYATVFTTGGAFLGAIAAAIFAHWLTHPQEPDVNGEKSPRIQLIATVAPAGERPSSQEAHEKQFYPL